MQERKRSLNRYSLTNKREITDYFEGFRLLLGYYVAYVRALLAFKVATALLRVLNVIMSQTCENFSHI